MDKETITKDKVLAVFAPIEKLPLQKSYTGYGKRVPSDRPPVLTPKELALMGPKDVADLTKNQGNGQVATTEPAGEHES
ncbi:MAG: ATP-dependent metalloprotease FtsH, partial [Actinomycetia bacterium]|nr:ATP-dependent metalloprotease FtsH [Actinomycetes bacterium]